MPPCTSRDDRPDVPLPKSSRSRSATSSPRIAASRATPHPLMPPPMTRTSNSLRKAPVILPKYKEFDRKIRISRFQRPSHPSARTATSVFQSGEKTMQQYRVVAVGSPITDVVRRTLKAPGYGHPAHVEVAAGYGPCRQCLRDFAVGQERRILFTYDPFYEKENL